MNNPALWIAIASVLTAIAGIVKAYKAKDSADTANELLAMHQENHAPSPLDDSPPDSSQTVTKLPEKS